MKDIKNKDIKAKKIIRLYILLSAMGMLSASFFIAIFFVFMTERGLSVAEISIVAFVVMTIMFIFEIPTGIIADIYGRKISYICSCFFMTVSLLIYIISNSLVAFLIAAIFHAISGTLSSGAFQAWLVDSLKYNSCSMPLNTIFIKERQITLSIGIIGALFGSFLADKNIMFPWIASIFAMLMAGTIATVFMKEEYFYRKKSSLAAEIKSAKKIIEAGIECVKNNKAVKFVLLIGLLQSFAIKAPFVQYQPFFSQFLPNKISLGFLWIAMTIFTIVGATLSSRLLLKLKNNHKKTLALSQIGIGIGILLSGIFIFPLSLFAFLFWNLTAGMCGPVSSEYLNENIPSKSRATIISLESMAYSAGSGIGLIFGGFLAEYFSIPVAWALMGGILVVLTILLMRNNNDKIKNEAT